MVNLLLSAFSVRELVQVTFSGRSYGYALKPVVYHIPTYFIYLIHVRFLSDRGFSKRLVFVFRLHYLAPRRIQGERALLASANE